MSNKRINKKKNKFLDISSKDIEIENSKQNVIYKSYIEKYYLNIDADQLLEVKISSENVEEIIEKVIYNIIHKNKICVVDISFVDVELFMKKINGLDFLEKTLSQFNDKLIVILKKNKFSLEKYNLRNDKVKIAEKLLLAYEKEENMLSSYKNLGEKLNKEISVINKKKLNIRKEKIETMGKLLEAYQKEEYLLNTVLNLKKENQKLTHKYNALSNSKLGKLTLWYWKKK